MGHDPIFKKTGTCAPCSEDQVTLRLQVFIYDAFAKLAAKTSVLKTTIYHDQFHPSLTLFPLYNPIRCVSEAVTDLQLAFSSGDRRLGMARMLERLPHGVARAEGRGERAGGF